MKPGSFSGQLRYLDDYPTKYTLNVDTLNVTLSQRSISFDESSLFRIQHPNCPLDRTRLDKDKVLPIVVYSKCFCNKKAYSPSHSIFKAIFTKNTCNCYAYIPEVSWFFLTKMS